jgi:hypothetical protein
VIRDTKVSFEWQLLAIGPVTSLEKELFEMSGGLPWLTHVDLYLGGKVNLKEAKVPLNIEVQSSGEIEKFVTDHESRREKAGKDAGK